MSLCLDCAPVYEGLVVVEDVRVRVEDAGHEGGAAPPGGRHHRNDRPGGLYRK